jgi:hypothetical protein
VCSKNINSDSDFNLKSEDFDSDFNLKSEDFVINNYYELRNIDNIKKSSGIKYKLIEVEVKEKDVYIFDAAKYRLKQFINENGELKCLILTFQPDDNDSSENSTKPIKFQYIYNDLCILVDVNNEHFFPVKKIENNAAGGKRKSRRRNKNTKKKTRRHRRKSVRRH